jgi:hypothetical protein
VVWQPEDVHLVRDLLELEAKPITEVLTIGKYKREDAEEDDELKTAANKKETNTTFTPMGRPVNIHPKMRWKALKLVAQSGKNQENEAAVETAEDYLGYFLLFRAKN